jgi:hypothetical protein
MESGRDLNATQLLQLYNGVALLQLQCLRILITPLATGPESEVESPKTDNSMAKCKRTPIIYQALYIHI